MLRLNFHNTFTAFFFRLGYLLFDLIRLVRIENVKGQWVDCNKLQGFIVISPLRWTPVGRISMGIICYWIRARKYNEESGIHFIMKIMAIYTANIYFMWYFFFNSQINVIGWCTSVTNNYWLSVYSEVLFWKPNIFSIKFHK